MPVAREAEVNGCAVRVVRGDLTAMDVDAVVVEARPDLALGSGHGTALSVRGGPGIQAELKGLGPLPAGKAVATGGGNLKARWVVHAVVPRFQEADEERLLREAVGAALARAEEKGARSVALPPLGSGFYGMPVDRCARIVVGASGDYLRGTGSALREIVFCVKDSHEVAPFQGLVDALGEGR